MIPQNTIYYLSCSDLNVKSQKIDFKNQILVIFISKISLLWKLFFFEYVKCKKISNSGCNDFPLM